MGRTEQVLALGSNTMFRIAAFGDGVVLGDKTFGESLEITQ